MNKKKFLRKLLSGSKNVRFNDMIIMVKAFGFTFSRQQGSHQIYVHPDIPELINLQNVNGQVKPYQIRQFLKLIERYDLTMED
ncbi:type II toxin-antitoxin system HicA family toxin [Verrucomicrobiota bacterium]